MKKREKPEETDKNFLLKAVDDELAAIGDKFLSGLAQEFIKIPNFLLKEAAIMENLVQSISELISAGIAESSSELKEKDKITFSRISARGEGQDAFHILFTPAPEGQTQKVKISDLLIIAKGKFLTKEIILMPDKDIPKEIADASTLFLKNFFGKMGYTVEEY